MSKLNNKKAVRELALLISEKYHTGRTRVSEEFIQHIEAATQKQIENRVLYHDNKTGSRKTLV